MWVFFSLLLGLVLLNVYSLATVRERTKKYWFVGILSLFCALLAGGLVATGSVKGYTHGCTVCGSHLKNLALAIESYHEEHQSYPETLEKLVEAEILPEIPRCLNLKPSAVANALYQAQGLSFSSPYVYERTKDETMGETWVVSCESGAHTLTTNTPKGYPRYSSVEGLIESP